ncbi:MAG: DUF4013 domain-containing protein [Methanobacterium sp.]|nr:DUF4013 domain-containing protein [Methanobacterium sp.]
MSLRDITLDSFRYTTSNWGKLIILGLVIFLTDKINELSYFQDLADEISIALIIISILLAIFEIGYIFRIVEETTHGSKALPAFNRIWETFFHGMKEILVTILYFIFPFLMVLLGAMQINNVIGHFSMEVDLFIILIGLFLASLLYLPFQAAVLNMAMHHGTIKSGFDIKNIIYKMRKMGFKNLGFIYILTVLFALVVRYSLSDTIKILPYGLGDLISSLIIAPFILVFTARTLGLINQLLVDKN